MKKSLFFILLAIISFNIASAQTIYSSDFEVWQSNRPVAWDGVNNSILGTSIT